MPDAVAGDGDQRDSNHHDAPATPPQWLRPVAGDGYYSCDKSTDGDEAAEFPLRPEPVGAAKGILTSFAPVRDVVTYLAGNQFHAEGREDEADQNWGNDVEASRVIALLVRQPTFSGYPLPDARA
jgi:hypothetical protein